MKPKIKVVKKGKKFQVRLDNSPAARKLGGRHIVIISTWTRDAAEDWISRIRGLRTKKRVLNLLMRTATVQ